MIWYSTALLKVAMHCSPVRAPSHEKRPPLEELHSTVPTTCGPHSSHALATATLSTTSEHMLAFNSTRSHEQLDERHAGHVGHHAEPRGRRVRYMG